MSSKKQPVKLKAKSASSTKPKAKAPAKAKAKVVAVAKVKAKTPAPKKPQPNSRTAKPNTVTAKKIPAAEHLEVEIIQTAVAVTVSTTATATASKAPSKAKAVRSTLDDLALDIDEKDDLLEEEKRDLIKALREDEDEPLETAFVPTDTSERFILVVDEEGQRRTETVTIVQQILPNAVVEVADDPEEALEVMQEADFDTYVVNFLMPGYSASQFVKAVANHPDHPLLIGFAADKISDALDQRKGLKIIPLKRLFDLDVNTDTGAKDKSGGAED